MISVKILPANILMVFPYTAGSCALYASKEKIDN